MLIRRQNRAGYAATIGSINTAIVVGGHTNVDGSEINENEFEPSIHNRFHGGNSFIIIHHINSGKTGRTDTQTDGVVKHEVNGYKHEIYTGENNTLKWDMLFDSNPGVPNLLFRIRHSKTLAFYKQELTQQQNGAAYAVPEAEGSYAVYYKDGRRDKQWQTGKVAHIYSPRFIDAIGASSPLCEMELVQVEPGIKRLVVSLPTLWLNGPARVYPVRFGQ